MTDYLSVPSKHGSAKDCMVSAESEMFRWGVWVVLKLEWSPRTPLVESCRGRSSFHQPPLLLLSLYGSPISILPFFLASAAPLSAPSPSFPSSWQRLLSWFRRLMPCLFFFCISGVMNISLLCYNMIAWQQAL